MTPLEFWFDFASTYSYPAAMRVDALAREAGVRIDWRPFLLGPIFQAQGWNDSPFNLQAAKGRYMWRDVERVCQQHGIAWLKPSQFPRNGLLAARVACAHAGADWVPDFIRAVFSANFAHDQDIADPAVIGACLSALGLDTELLLTTAQSPEAKAALRAQSDQAAALEIFGAPFFRVGGEHFWGNDRLEQALARCVTATRK